MEQRSDSESVRENSGGLEAGEEEKEEKGMIDEEIRKRDLE